MDKYGRKVKKTTADDMQQFYRLDERDSEQEQEEKSEGSESESESEPYVPLLPLPCAIEGPMCKAAGDLLERYGEGSGRLRLLP